MRSLLLLILVTLILVPAHSAAVEDAAVDSLQA